MQGNAFYIQLKGLMTILCYRFFVSLNHRSDKTSLKEKYDTGYNLGFCFFFNFWFYIDQALIWISLYVQFFMDTSPFSKNKKKSISFEKLKKVILGTKMFFFLFETLKGYFWKFGAPFILSYITMLFSCFVIMDNVPSLIDFNM